MRFIKNLVDRFKAKSVNFKAIFMTVVCVVLDVVSMERIFWRIKIVTFFPTNCRDSKTKI